MASQDAWSGWIVFAGIVILIVGAMDVLQGFVAILKDEYVVATAKGLAILDVTAWGWATLIWGALLVLAALGLLGRLLPPSNRLSLQFFPSRYGRSPSRHRPLGFCTAVNPL